MTDSYIVPIKSNINPTSPAKPLLQDIFIENKLHLVSLAQNIKPDNYSFFCWLLASEAPRERARRVQLNQGGKYRWEWPFATGFIYCCKKFLGLSTFDRNFIIAARQEDIYWRGDNREAFEILYHETMAMQEMSSSEKSNYRSNSKQKAADFVKSSCGT